MSKRGTTRDWRVKYTYPGVRRYDPELDIEWIDTSDGSYTGVWVDNYQGAAEIHAEQIAHRGGLAEVHYVDPASKKWTLVSTHHPANPIHPELEGGNA